jgi:gluconolactonase
MMGAELLVDYDAIETLDPRFARLTLDNAPLEKLAEGFRWLEGLVWMGDWDALLFQDLPRDRTLMWRESAGVSVWRQPSHFANGQARDRQGRLLSCSHRLRAILRTEYDGAVTTVVDRCEGKRLNSPNDIVVARDGAIWFTDPTYGIANDYEGGIQESERAPALYRYDPARDCLTIAASDFDNPNGLAFSPDGKRLYVSETGDQTQPDPAQFIRAFYVGESGRLSGGQLFCRIQPGYCDGLKVDAFGHLWCSAADGVHCLTPHGEAIGKIRIPYRVSNLCFGGRARNRLFIGGSHTLYAIYLNTRGAVDH